MADNFTKEAFTLLGVGVTVVALRTYARFKMVGIRKFMLDDYLMLLAVVVYGLETGAAYSVGARFHGLANNSMTDEQRRTLSPDSPEDPPLRAHPYRWSQRCTASRQLGGQRNIRGRGDREPTNDISPLRPHHHEDQLKLLRISIIPAFQTRWIE
ncbi:MAG: hypothetical protein Q9218_006981, partial [Villophora microphyllina]